MVAATWYLIVTSILMVGQYYLERYYSRGASRKLTTKQLEALAKAQTENPGGMSA
jgi:polar amino acid transport system permease protein